MRNVFSIKKAETLNFQGGQILAILNKNNEAFVSLNHACETLGIAYTSQRKKVLEDPVLARASFYVRMKDSTGRAQRSLVLHKEALPSWLMSININRVKQESRDKVTAFKHEAYKALDLWFNKELQNSLTEEQKKTVQETPDQQRGRYSKELSDLRKELSSLKREHRKTLKVVSDRAKQNYQYLVKKILLQDSFSLRDVAYVHQVNEASLSDAVEKAGIVFRSGNFLFSTKSNVTDKLVTPASTSTQVRFTEKGMKWLESNVIPSLDKRAGAV